MFILNLAACVSSTKCESRQILMPVCFMNNLAFRLPKTQRAINQCKTVWGEFQTAISVIISQELSRLHAWRNFVWLLSLILLMPNMTRCMPLVFVSESAVGNVNPCWNSDINTVWSLPATTGFSVLLIFILVELWHLLSIETHWPVFMAFYGFPGKKPVCDWRE